MEALELACYSAEYITPAAEAFSWYQAHPHSVTVAWEGSSIVGFVNLLPVSREMFARIRAGEFNDSEMTAADILSLEECLAQPFELFLSCVVVDERYRGRGLARQLVGQALSRYVEGGMSCQHVVTDNVTLEGRRFSERLGFRLVCESDHGSRVYQCAVEDLAKTLGM